MRILHVCLSNFYVDNYNYQENIVEISPNPTSDVVTVSAKNFKSANLYNLNGQLLDSNLTHVINMKQFPSGIYIVAVHLKDGEIVTKKIIKKWTF